MPAGRGDLSGTPSLCLPDHVGEVSAPLDLALRGIRSTRGEVERLAHRGGRHVRSEAMQQAGQVGGGVDLQAVHQPCLLQVLLGHDRAGDPQGPGGEQGGEHARDGPHPAVQTQLSQQHGVPGDMRGQFALGIQDRHRDREVEA